jgi:hypothetical protein
MRDLVGYCTACSPSYLIVECLLATVEVPGLDLIASF